MIGFSEEICSGEDSQVILMEMDPDFLSTIQSEGEIYLQCSNTSKPILMTLSLSKLRV